MALNDIANKDATILAITNYFSPLIKTILKSRIDASGLTAQDKIIEKAKIDDLDFTTNQEYQANIKSIVYKLYDNIVLFLGSGGGSGVVIPEAVTDVTFDSLTQTLNITKEPLTINLTGGNTLTIPNVITNITFDSMTQSLNITREDYNFTI